MSSCNSIYISCDLCVWYGVADPPASGQWQLISTSASLWQAPQSPFHVPLKLQLHSTQCLKHFTPRSGSFLPPLKCTWHQITHNDAWSMTPVVPKHDQLWEGADEHQGWRMSVATTYISDAWLRCFRFNIEYKPILRRIGTYTFYWDQVMGILQVDELVCTFKWCFKNTFVFNMQKI